MVFFMTNLTGDMVYIDMVYRICDNTMYARGRGDLQSIGQLEEEDILYQSFRPIFARVVSHTVSHNDIFPYALAQALGLACVSYQYFIISPIRQL